MTERRVLKWMIFTFCLETSDRDDDNQWNMARDLLWWTYNHLDKEDEANDQNGEAQTAEA